MLIFGLTGGVGSGKSTVAAMLREEGIPIVDADELSRQVTSAREPVLAELAREFGSSVLSANGELDRAQLASIVFSDEAARHKLNGLLHPRIASAAQQEFEKLGASGHSLVGYEVPLLFETNQEKRYRPAVLVACSEEEQLSRASQRSHWSREETLKRIRAQMPLDQKRERADWIVENSGDWGELRAQVKKLAQFLRGSLGSES